jgi:hypothetical protein
MTEALTCPACGGKTVVPIAYGLPGPEMQQAARRGELVLGGCVLWDDQPAFQCLECRNGW